MTDFKSDVSFWYTMSLSSISLWCLACCSISWRLCSSCCRCICTRDISMLSSRMAISFWRTELSVSSTFSLPPPKREPTFATSAAFTSVLAASSLFGLTFCLTSSSCCSACCYSVCNCTLVSTSPVCCIKGRIGLLSYAVLPSHVRLVANRIFYYFCVTVVVGDQFLTCQHVIGTQAHGIGFLTVGTFAISLILLGFPALVLHFSHIFFELIACYRYFM